MGKRWIMANVVMTGLLWRGIAVMPVVWEGQPGPELILAVMDELESMLRGSVAAPVEMEFDPCGYPVCTS